jgi:hypothetical protein
MKKIEIIAVQLRHTDIGADITTRQSLKGFGLKIKNCRPVFNMPLMAKVRDKISLTPNRYIELCTTI